MSDLETMLAPLVESAPDPAPLSTVVARAAGIRRRRRARAAALAVVVVGAVSAGVVALIPRDRQRVRTVATSPVTSAPRPITVGPPQTFPLVGMDMISAYGSLWLSQSDHVARFDPTTGRVIATIGVRGSSDYRELAAGAGSIWIADTGTGVVSRIDPTTNRVIATISMSGSPYVPQGIAFFDG
jgi:YVTN family beta-propeller protein